MRILIVSHPPLRSDLGAAQMALNLGEALRLRGHKVVVWSPEPLPAAARWFDRWRWQRRRLEDFVRREGPFDIVDVPPVSVSRRLAREAPVVARSIQPDLRYAWVELGEGFRKRPASPRIWIRTGAHAAHSLVIAGAIVSGWHRARVVLALGTSEAKWIRRRFPWLARRLRCYLSAPAATDQARFAKLRRDRVRPPGPGLRFLWIGRWAAHKGPGRLIRFLVARLRSHPADSFTIAGCGPDAARDVPPELLVEGTVRIVESYTREDLSALLSAHDVGLFTSRAEGWGLSLNEMLESGLPIYGTPAGAIEDLAPLVDGALRPFPPPETLAPETVPPPADLGRYLEVISWAAIAERYEADVLGILEPVSGEHRLRDGAR